MIRCSICGEDSDRCPHPTPPELSVYQALLKRKEQLEKELELVRKAIIHELSKKYRL